MPRVSSERSFHSSALLRFALLVGMAGCSGSRDQEVTRGRDAGSPGEEGTSDAKVASDPGDGDATVISLGDADASVAASDDATSGADSNDSP